jgi:hypothetical protein
MLQPDLPLPFDVDVDPSQEDPGENPRRQMSERAIYRLLF